MTKPLFTLTKYDLKVANFASTDEVRPVICGVLVRVNEGNYELCATDAYILIVHKIREFIDKEFEQFIIPAEKLRLANKLVGTSKKDPSVVEVYKDKLVVMPLGISLPYTPTQGSYPDFDKLIRDNVDRAGNGSVMLDAKYVKTVAEFFKGADNGDGMDIQVNNKLAPTEFKNNRTYAVVMPLKS